MQIKSTLLVVPVFIVACGESAEPGAGHDAATLDSYREAIPSEERLISSAPTADGDAFALTSGNVAVLAAQGVAFARSVNQPARLLVAALRTITDLPPTRFEASERRFVWGPWDNDRGVGQVALVVTRNEPGADFDYSYALVRSMDGELRDATAVIAGGATPDRDDPDRGVGVALWDLEANRSFVEQNDPEADLAAEGGGRFVMLFGHQATEMGDARFNVAVFRNFVGEREVASSDAPAALDVDYFYGRFTGNDRTRVDFVDSVAHLDVCGASGESCFDEALVAGISERFNYNAFFVNRGLGRAEVQLSEGDLESAVRIVECWSPALAQTSFQVEANGEMVETLENGSCTAPADQSAHDLGLPTLTDIDPAMLDAMSCAAENGLIGCE